MMREVTIYLMGRGKVVVPDGANVQFDNHGVKIKNEGDDVFRRFFPWHRVKEVAVRGD